MARERKIKGMGNVAVTGAPTHDRIARRAYEIYLERGCEPGHDLDDWLQAQYELFQLPVDKLAKLPASRTFQDNAKRWRLVDVVRSAFL